MVSFRHYKIHIFIINAKDIFIFFLIKKTIKLHQRDYGDKIIHILLSTKFKFAYHPDFS